MSIGESTMEQVINKINEDIEIARTSVDLGKFSDNEISYNLEEITPSISIEEIEDIFINSQSLKDSGYLFSKSDLPGVYNMTLPDEINNSPNETPDSGYRIKKVTFKPKVFEENSQSVELMSYMHPIFEKIINEKT